MSIAPFYIGQRVVVIQDIVVDLFYRKQLLAKRDDVFTIKSITKCCTWMVDIGFIIPDSGRAVQCSDCKTIFHIMFIHYQFFAPIQEQFQAIEYTKIMENELSSVN